MNITTRNMSSIIGYIVTDKLCFGYLRTEYHNSF